MFQQSDLRKGFSLGWLDNAVGSLVKCVHLNRVTIRNVADRRMAIKCRNLFGKRIIPLANWFFAASGAPVSFWENTGDWQN